MQKVKCDLSEHETARFQFSDGVVDLDAMVQRCDFEGWIAEELGQIEECVDALLEIVGG